MWFRHIAPDADRPSGAQPVLCLLENCRCRSRRFGMCLPGKADRWSAPFVGSGGVEFNAAIWVGYLVNRPFDLRYKTEIAAHEVMRGLPPAGHVLWQGMIPENDGQHDKVVSQHCATNHAGQTVDEIRGGDGDPRSPDCIYGFVEKPVGRGIGMALEVAPNEAGVIADAVGLRRIGG